MQQQTILDKIITHQKRKYKKKGFKICYAFINLAILLFFVPQILHLLLSFIIHRYSKIFIYIFTLSSTNLLVLIVFNIGMIPIYCSKSQFFQKHRIFKKPWPWQKNPKEWRNLLIKSIILTLCNCLIFAPLLGFASTIFSAQQRIIYDGYIPGGGQILWQMYFFMILEDGYQFITHSLFHTGYFYKIHKIHHEYIAPVSISSEYAHPIQFVFGNSMGSAVGYLILSFFTDVHLITIITWIIFRICTTCEQHSGYNWDWSVIQIFPMGVVSDFHSSHHTHNKGNLGSLFIIWDLLAGSYIDVEQLSKQPSQKVN